MNDRKNKKLNKLKKWEYFIDQISIFDCLSHTSIFYTLGFVSEKAYVHAISAFVWLTAFQQMETIFLFVSFVLFCYTAIDRLFLLKLSNHPDFLLRSCSVPKIPGSFVVRKCPVFAALHLRNTAVNAAFPFR